MAEFLARCVHWTGRACARGVDLEVLRDVEMRIPCMSVNGKAGGVCCDLREPPEDPEPLAPGLATTMLERALRGACAECGEPITSVIEAGAQLVALPCRHPLQTRRSA